MSRDAVGRTLDEQSRAIIYEGANLTQLGVIFRIDHTNLVAKIRGLQPAGERSGVAIYSIAEVSQRLWRPTEAEVSLAMRRMHHSDLPKILTKEYWAGLRSRQEYEFRAGQLWPTEKVVEKVGELMKLVKMSAQLMTDNIERSDELTDRQRKKMKALTNSMLDDLYKMILENFSQIDAAVAVNENHNDDDL
jgi:hypothetical protein